MEQKLSRKEQILLSLASELERSPGERITTAVLARATGVSEAALYRHFASKAKMFEGLIGFAEEAVFARINQILEDERDARTRSRHIFYLVLAFADKNPGITRVLLGDALVGETDRLHNRVEQFFSRLETQIRQVLRETRLRGDANIIDPERGAGLVLAVIEGKLHRFLRTRFRESPVADWETHWQMLQEMLFNGS